METDYRLLTSWLFSFRRENLLFLFWVDLETDPSLAVTRNNKNSRTKHQTTPYVDASAVFNPLRLRFYPSLGFRLPACFPLNKIQFVHSPVAPVEIWSCSGRSQVPSPASGRVSSCLGPYVPLVSLSKISRCSIIAAILSSGFVRASRRIQPLYFIFRNSFIKSAYGYLSTFISRI